ncbi:hypothetical protein [Aquisalimonas asiatica]|uniref:Uncharacterized protein n=1 Tax=Aquisalimonas asiatica TaxID=406100 RepID=A0A1H8VV50_9GAMM|nr:hypothetical protein [Aquisalimonas asiatica]SEP19271.1 hypothetical protein SAMN04488052_11629 [Aquisalimonas asiatica]
MWMIGSLGGGIVASILAYVFVSHIAPDLGPYMLIPVALNAVGTGLIALRWWQTGAYMVLAGAIPIMPVGLVSVPGVSRALDMAAEHQFLEDTGNTPGGLTEPDMEFAVSPWRLIIGGGAFFVISGVLLVIPPSIALGIVFVLMGLWSRKNARLRMHPTYLDLKEFPAKGRRLVRYKDVETVEQVGRKALRLTYRPGGAESDEKPRRFRIKLGELNDAERSMLYRRLTGELEVEVPQFAATA